MKKLKFIKDHIAGIPAGSVKQAADHVADRLIKDGYAVEDDGKPFVPEDAKTVKDKKAK